MRFEKKIVTTYGNSKVINVSDYEKGEVLYIIDQEMLDFIRGFNK